MGKSIHQIVRSLMHYRCPKAPNVFGLWKWLSTVNQYKNESGYIYIYMISLENLSSAFWNLNANVGRCKSIYLYIYGSLSPPQPRLSSLGLQAFIYVVVLVFFTEGLPAFRQALQGSGWDNWSYRVPICINENMYTHLHIHTCTFIYNRDTSLAYYIYTCTEALDNPAGPIIYRIFCWTSKCLCRSEEVVWKYGSWYRISFGHRWTPLQCLWHFDCVRTGVA